MTERDDRIREIAYFLWLQEGRPEDQAERHWQAAEILFNSEPVERKRIEGEPPGDPAGVSQEPAAPPSGATPPAPRNRNVAYGKGE